MTRNSTSDEFDARQARVSDGELVIRPCTEQYKQMLKATPVLLLIPVSFLVLRQGVTGVVLAAATAAVCVVVMYFYFRGVHVVVTHTEIGRSGFTSRRKMRPRADIATVVTASLPLSAMDSRIANNLFVLDQRGRPILRLKSTHWTEEDMTSVIERLGMRPVTYPRIVTAKELSRAHPRALPWIERRPIQSAVVLTLAIIAAIVAGILVFADI
ncbi:hypothetical protein G1H11_19840 [Phytoactinopolyspora alkaliphila]|uniref:Uncharacterized protein n=1 Tax=Phytoactinopolyspora alkaliphila TaxID=1783498 RepID=A0A6N9YRA2_9ACTN|nr:hypothetical protein [Phytoactinopolyspora alkaliphila]NED97553.1 hypothetical protein [Phytoactinopolyspora alkaliphila]